MPVILVVNWQSVSLGSVFTKNRVIRRTSRCTSVCIQKHRSNWNNSSAVTALESNCLLECNSETQLSVALSQLHNQNMSDCQWCKLSELFIITSSITIWHYLQFVRLPAGSQKKLLPLIQTRWLCFSGMWHRWATRKAHFEPYIHRFAGCPKIEAQDIHVTPGYRPLKQTFSRSTTDKLSMATHPW